MSAQANFTAHDLGMTSPPIGDLPPEILSLIFMLVHQDLKTQKGELSKGMSVLSATCKDWHLLASSLPELWSSIEIIVADHWQNPKVPSHWQSQLTMVTTFLERSRNLPLFLTLEFGALDRPTLNHTKLRFATAAFQLLLRNFYRWHSISFDFGSYFEPPSIPEGAAAPMLEHINVLFQSRYWQKQEYSTALVAAAPGLRSYSVVGTSKNPHVPANLPWGQLQKFHLTDFVQPKDALFFLDQAKSLREFHIPILSWTRGSVDLSVSYLPKITSAIRSMHVSGIGPCDVQLLLSHLETPNLNNLGLRFVHDICGKPKPVQFSFILTFLSSGSFQLSSLAIVNLTMSESDLIKCLRLLSPSLTTLGLRIRLIYDSDIRLLEVVTNNILDSLTYHDSKSEILCPILESLTLEHCIDSDDGVLSDMVQSRRWLSPMAAAVNGQASRCDVTTLRHLDVVFATDTHPVDQKRLTEFYREGLSGVVRYGAHIRHRTL